MKNNETIKQTNRIDFNFLIISKNIEQINDTDNATNTDVNSMSYDINEKKSVNEKCSKILVQSLIDLGYIKNEDIDNEMKLNLAISNANEDLKLNIDNFKMPSNITIPTKCFDVLSNLKLATIDYCRLKNYLKNSNANKIESLIATNIDFKKFCDKHLEGKKISDRYAENDNEQKNTFNFLFDAFKQKVKLTFGNTTEIQNLFSKKTSEIISDPVFKLFEDELITGIKN